MKETQATTHTIPDADAAGGRGDDELFGHAITRRIWMDVDNLILVYVGSAAEFPLIKENHWLFYTGKLPRAPMERFIDTVSFNHRIFTSPVGEVRRLATQIRDIHTNLERKRSEEEGRPRTMSNEAFKQVGAMLIDYGISGFEYLHRRRLTDAEKATYYEDERSFMQMMGVEDLEPDYPAFVEARARMLRESLAPNELTDRFFRSYRQNLGIVRFSVLMMVTDQFVSRTILEKLGRRPSRFWAGAYRAYPQLRCRAVMWLTRRLLLTPGVRETLRHMEQTNAALAA